jgi:hypothetical protein
MNDAIHSLPPAELRGCAIGLRLAAARMVSVTLFNIQSARAELMREADLIEGFAARLDAAEAREPEPALRDIDGDQFRFSPESMAEVEAMLPTTAEAPPHAPTPADTWAARFEAAARRTVAHPTGAVTVCAAADAQCVAGCTMPQDGRCARDAPAHPSLAGWFQPANSLRRFSTLAEALAETPEATPVAMACSEWAGTRYAFRVPSDEGTYEICLTETLEEAQAYIADPPSPEHDPTPTPEETAQAGLADAVAESLADDQAQRHSTKALPDDVKARAREMFLKGVPMPKIGAQLGIPKTTINTWASKYGWREERDAGKGRPAGMPRAKPTPIAAVPDAMTTEDKAEARERLRTGKSKGARDIMDWFGCTQAEAQALVDEHRARGGKAA